MARKDKSKATETVEATETTEAPAAAAMEVTFATPLELVDDPGPVKRIRFDGFAPPAPTPEPLPETPVSEPTETTYAMAVPQDRPARPAALGGTGTIRSVHDEVDRLGSPDPTFSGAPSRANLQSWRSNTIYRTDRGGEVRSYDGPNGRLLTLGNGREEHRFSEEDVDRVIAGVTLDGASEPATVETEPAPTAAMETTETTAQRRRLFGFLGRRGGSSGTSTTPPAATETESKEYQPQCSALTEEGLQCRNSARGGSKYCSSHYGYQPRTAQGVLATRDTEPRFASSRDTMPGAAGWDPGADHATGVQCGALTAAGLQCTNPVVAGTSFCGVHQDATLPTPKGVLAAADTKPRWSGAKDTKPSTRKAAGRKPASKSSKKGRR